MKEITANKGEWAELYALTKIFVDKKLTLCDEKLLDSDEYIQLDVKTVYEGDNIAYDLTEYGIVLLYSGQARFCIPGEYLEKTMNDLRFTLRSITPRTFPVRSGSDLLEVILKKNLKSDSTSKADIIVMIACTSSLSEVDYLSVKSRFGGPPTLVNASRHTKCSFTLRTENGSVIPQTFIAALSDLSVKKRVEFLLESSVDFKPENFYSLSYRKSLKRIDECFPLILVYLTLAQYTVSPRTLENVFNSPFFQNQLNLNKIQAKDAKQMIKKYLEASAFGLTPSIEWDGNFDSFNVNGYIVVKDTGDLVTFYSPNIEAFRKYLFSAAYFDSPSTSRHDYGFITKDGCFELCLQIRMNLQT